MLTQEEPWITEGDRKTDNTARSRQRRGLFGSLTKGRIFAAILAVFLVIFLVLVAVNMFAAFSDSNNLSLALSNTLTPLGFCILLVLAIMAIISDRRMD